MLVLPAIFCAFLINTTYYSIMEPNMDEKVAKALEFANYRQTLNNQIQTLKVRTETQLIISKNGGTFHINESLISFLNFLILFELY